ncbi:MAG: DNA polymerase IV [Thermoplasmata archaeon]|nr:DNA polymerase IV [Thermoplasmata archaeon]
MRNFLEDGDEARGAPSPESWVVYIDLDAYYVSCEVRDRPELVGKEVIVGPPPSEGPTRGVVLSASYEARRHGVKSAMPAQAAARLAPEAIWIPPDFAKYERVAEEVRDILRRFSSEVVPFSIDEAAVGLGPVSSGEAREVAEKIQRSLRKELDLPASLGVATSRIVAKIATDRAKPGGIIVVETAEVAAFLEPLPVRAIPGVGPKTESLLDSLDVKTIGELALCRPRDLERVVGSFARELIALARGTPVERHDIESGPHARSTDHTFARDANTWDEIAPALTDMADELGRSLDRQQYRYGAVSVAFRWGDFTRSQHGGVLPGAAEGAPPLREAALRFGRELWERSVNSGPRAVRTVSVRAERLEIRSRRQTTLADFDAGASRVK